MEVQYMIKKIISNFFFFCFILVFISIFKILFTPINGLVGITTLVAFLILMSKDLTKKPIKSFIFFLTINLISGVCAHIASYTILLGVFLNFIVITIFGYILSYNLTKTILVPIGLQYFLMLYTPVPLSGLPLRLCALATGALVIMVSQFIIHGGKKKITVENSEVLSYEPEPKDDYIIKSIFNKNISVHPLRAAYALRIGTLVAITTFIEALLIKYLNLIEGRWMVYTIFSLTELYSQNCRIKSKERFEGTLIGSIIILVIFILVKDSVIRSLVILLTGFANTFVSTYRDTMIVVTISAIASTALTAGTLTTVIERIGFVAIGIVIALIGDKYLFPETRSKHS